MRMVVLRCQNSWIGNDEHKHKHILAHLDQHVIKRHLSRYHNEVPSQNVNDHYEKIAHRASGDHIVAPVSPGSRLRTRHGQRVLNSSIRLSRTRNMPSDTSTSSNTSRSSRESPRYTPTAAHAVSGSARGRPPRRNRVHGSATNRQQIQSSRRPS